MMEKKRRDQTNIDIQKTIISTQNQKITATTTLQPLLPSPPTYCNFYRRNCFLKIPVNLFSFWFYDWPRNAILAKYVALPFWRLFDLCCRKKLGATTGSTCPMRRTGVPINQNLNGNTNIHDAIAWQWNDN